MICILSMTRIMLIVSVDSFPVSTSSSPSFFGGASFAFLNSEGSCVKMSVCLVGLKLDRDLTAKLPEDAREDEEGEEDGEGGQEDGECGDDDDDDDKEEEEEEEEFWIDLDEGGK